ncbi:MAG TPA: matrixin family metalloprotease [Candidatus Dormibacteraeota bacterium]|nr:matrixin family metalloprotease [Candidatus Dormibacteraeota bacterium]
MSAQAFLQISILSVAKVTKPREAGLLWILALLATLPGARAFNYTYNSSGNVQHWSFSPPDPAISTNVFNTNTHAIRFFIASEGYSVTNTANELNAVRNSFGQWQAISNTLVKFEDAGLVAPGYDVNNSDNTNVVYWAKVSTIVNGGNNDISGALAVTFKRFSVPASELLQFDIAINGVEQGWFTDPGDPTNPNFFVEGTLAHEIGHALGLSHSSIGGATLLYAGLKGVDTQAGLSNDEIAFAHALYPTNGAVSPLGNLKGTITKNGSPVLCAAVVLEDSKGNLACGTVSLTNGTYTMNAIPPGNYNARVVPLDSDSAGEWLIQPQELIIPAGSAAQIPAFCRPPIVPSR